MNVEFTVLKRLFELHKEEYEAAILHVLHSGRYVLGDELEKFENEFAEYIGVKHCIGLNSGLDALILAVRALGIGTGDEVIVPGNTFIGSVIGITENGATPVFIEPDGFYTIDANKIENAITKRTKAIIPVHLYGQSCDMQKIKKIAQAYDLYIIEDCAQSHGATFEGKKTGSFSDIACFSFYPTKPLGAMGDSGAIVTNNDLLAEKLQMMRNYGSRKKYINEISGINSRLDELQAALLRISLKYLDKGNDERNRIASRYMTEIKNDKIILPQIREQTRHVFHLFVIRCKERDNLQQFLLERDIRTQIHYPIPPHLAQCYEFLGYSRGDMPITEKFADEVLSLPIYTGMPEDEIDYVIDIINQY